MDRRDPKQSVAAMIGACVIDDPVEFGNWCAHGYALLEQERHRLRQERSMASVPPGAVIATGPAPMMTMGEDRIPMMESSGTGPTPEQAARWHARQERAMQQGQYSQPDAYDVATHPHQFDSPALPPQADIVADLQRKVEGLLASLQHQVYAPNAMPQVQQFAPQAVVPQVVSPWPVRPMAGGYMPGRRY